MYKSIYYINIILFAYISSTLKNIEENMQMPTMLSLGRENFRAVGKF